MEAGAARTRGAERGGAPTIDVQLRELGIWRLPVPTPFSDEPVNVYAIEDDGGGLALLDTGVGGPVATGVLAEAFWRIGSGFTDVRRIFVTHGHADHFGAAPWLRESARREVPVFAHPADFPRIVEGEPRWEDQLPYFGRVFARHGVPPDLYATFARRELAFDEYACRVRAVRPLSPGDVLRFARFEATVLHLPGHTPGLVCLYDAARGLLFSNDHLLERATPGLDLYIGPTGEELPARSLATYLESLRLTRTLDVGTVLPGHGAPFRGHREAIDNVLRVHARRLARVQEVLSRGPASAFAIARAIFPRTAVAELMASLAQVLGNLEILQARGEAASEDEAGVLIHRAVG